ncbi:MAG: type II toxin-antitoxin system ParD family antitoxin [Pleurocapsa sp. MO_226.B13]|nr:type II toxin-antitoxin system ParD family antitoxin [Pleurocapsa sp. MO_226.B13]
MNVSLTEELEKFVQSQVESGMYYSASEVIRDGLRLLKEKDLLRQIKIEELRKEIQKGIDQLDRGEYATYDSDSLESFATDIKQKARKKASQKRKSEAV